MTTITTKLILFLSLLTTLSTCQDNAEKKAAQINPPAVGEIVSELDPKIWSIFQDQKGNYWFGSNGNGLYQYDGKKLKLYTAEDGLIDNTIRGIQGDHLGNVFIGTPVGVSKFDGTRFTSLEPIISSSNEWKVKPNDLWFNCNGNSLYRYDGESLFELELPIQNLMAAFGREVQGVPFKGMNNSPYAVYGIDKDKAGNLWLGTVTAGAFRYDASSAGKQGDPFLWIGEKELSTLPDGRVPGVRSLLEDKNGFYWLSNFKSKYRIIEKDSNITYEKLDGIGLSNEHFEDRRPFFNSGVSDKNGDLWVTTYGGGVWKYDGEKLINIPVKDGYREVLLISIYIDNEGIIWLGSDNVGVYKFNGETFDRFVPVIK